MYTTYTEKLTPEEKWEKLSFANNFIFYKVLHDNPKVCKELLEILLKIKIEKIVMYNEEEIFVDYGSKGIRLDVYAKNETQAFNIEMQSYDSKDLSERSRYYQGVIDVDSLKSGEKYNALKDSYVIFICMKDIFEKGLPLYSFENLCSEDNKIKLNDRTYKLFFIAENCDKILDEKQKSFLNFVTKNKSSDRFTEKLDLLTKEAKTNLQVKRKYMEWERQRTYDIEYGIEKGREEGSLSRAISTAKNLKASGVSIELIAKCTGLSLEEVAAL